MDMRKTGGDISTAQRGKRGRIEEGRGGVKIMRFATFDGKRETLHGDMQCLMQPFFFFFV